MGPFFFRRYASRQRFWLIAGACASMLLLPCVSRAADPVRQLRDALKILTATTKLSDQQRAAKLKVKNAIPELKTISHLRRAYLLPEWSLDVELDQEITDLRKKIAESLTKAIQNAAEEENIDKRDKEDKQLAIAMLIAQIAAGESLADREEKEKFTRRLTGVVLELAKRDNVVVRQAALHALGKITPDPKDAFPILEATLRSDKEPLGPRRHAAYALTDLVKNAPHLKRKERLETIRQAIDTAAGHAKGAHALRDPDDWVRAYCLQAIQESAKVSADQFSSEDDLLVKGKKTLEPELLPILKAYQAINPQLLQALDDPEPNVRVTAMQALNQIGNMRAKFVQTLHDIDPENDRKLILKSFYESDDPLAKIVGDLRKITPFLKKDEVALRRGAIDFLEMLGDQAEPALAEIAQALRDPDRLVRWSAARTMLYMPPLKVGGEAVRNLGSMLIDPDPNLSKAAADAIEALGPAAHDAVDWLAFVSANGDTGSHNWDTENRVAAMSALVSIGGTSAQRAIPKILTALSDPDVRVRRQAAETLGRLGRPADADLARQEIAALKNALRDEDSEVRLSASEAILSIAAAAKKGL